MKVLRPRWVFISLVCFPATALPAWGQLQRLGGAEFIQRVWTSEQGLPGNSVTSILQTADGFMWVGTFGGLARFDGVQFDPFDVKNTPALRSDRITALHSDGHRGFWIVSEQSDLARFDGSTFIAYNRRTGAPIDKGTAGFLDDDGGYWIAGEKAIHHVMANGVVRRWGSAEGVPDDDISQIVRDAGGTYLFASGGGLFAIRGGAQRVERIEDPIVTGLVTRFAPRRAGGHWVIGEHGLSIWEQGALRHFQNANDAPGKRGLGVAEAADGTLWIATANHGLEQWRGGRGESLPLAAVPGVDARTRAVFVGREGNVWFAPNGGGLVRWSPARVTSFTKADGLFRDDTWSIVQDRAGVIWASAWMLHRVRGNRVDTVPGFSGVSALHPDPDGGLWVGHEHGLTKLEGNRRTNYAVNPPQKVNAIRAIFRDRTGRVFIGRSGGVLELRDGALVDALDGSLRAARGVSLITEDSAGTLYFGGPDGLRIWRDGKLTMFTSADGLAHNHVRAVHPTASGALWIGTYGGGLSRLSNGQFARVSTTHGLVEDAVSRIIDDGMGHLWLSGNRGVSRVKESELTAVADGKLARVNPVLFGVADGMPTNETEGWMQWAGWKATDGKLWIPTIKGIAVIDPSMRHTLVPPVAVTAVLFDGQPVAHASGIHIPPGAGDLEIRYTAMSYIAPEKVRFKYRLEGFDSDWIDPGARRTAYYTRVPPGNYTFRVIAANDDGVWNDVGTSLPVLLEPRFYQRKSVWALGALLLVAVAAFGVRWRLQRLHERLGREQAIAERLREVDKLKDEFLANTSHELRTPLNGIIGLAQSLASGVGGQLTEPVKNDLDLIASSGMRLSRLVNDILDLSRLRRNALALNQTPVDVVTALTVALTLSRPLVAGKPVALSSEAALDLPLAHADEDRLQQILLNLIANAAKFTSQGTIKVIARRAGSMIEIEVADTGIGIPADQHERIFNAFTQADPSATRHFGGMGLGLTVTRRLVELHGGTVRVESTPGVGSRFMFTLPVSDAPVAEPKRAVSTAAGRSETFAPGSLVGAPSSNGSHEGNGSRVGGRRVLVVDDDTVNARVLSQILTLEHYAVDVAVNGPDALALALRDDAPFDLVLLDLMMPGMDGFTVCERIRERYPIEVLPVILVTARNTVDDLVGGLAGGANDFIAKPVSRDELLTRVRTHLALAEANRQLRATRDGLEEQVRIRTEDLRASNGELAGANERLAELNGQLASVNAGLGRANDGMRSILDQLRTGVITTDASGNIVFASRTAEQILECGADDALGARWDNLVRVDDGDRAAFKALVAAPPSKRELLATRVCSPSGRRYWVEIEVQDDPRDTGGRILYFNDVSDLYALPPTPDASFHDLVGQSSAMRLLFKEIRDIARSDATVLIEGETGTGKELIARAIHASSARRTGPLVALNCAGLAESILASQLFGHKRGAFTGAVADQPGLVEAASGGTLFLDEIGDIPLSVQATLLRTLQEREVVRLGETRPRRIDVRIVAATHRDLAKLTAEGAFREDFLYRVRVARIKVPPLRQRLDDVPPLVAAFLRQIATSKPLEISSEAMEFLIEHPWPGNVRELRAALEHAAVRCRGAVIRPNDLPPEILQVSPWTTQRAVASPTEMRQQVVDALAKTAGNRSAAARLLGISRPTLYTRLRGLGLIDS